MLVNVNYDIIRLFIKKKKDNSFVSSAEQWKLLGQEKDGSILIGWMEESERNDVCTSCTVIGRYDQIDNKLQVRTIRKKNLLP